MSFLGFQRLGTLMFDHERYDCLFGLDFHSRGIDLALFLMGWGIAVGIQFGHPKEGLPIHHRGVGEA